MSPAEKQRLKTDIQRKQDEAERLIERASKAEQQGLVSESFALLEKAQLVAADLPQLRQKMDKMGDATLVTQAVKKRVLRREQVVQQKQPASSPLQKALLFMVVIAVLVVAAVFIAGQLSSSPDNIAHKQKPLVEPEAAVQTSDKSVGIEQKGAAQPQDTSRPEPEPEITAEKSPPAAENIPEVVTEVPQPPVVNEKEPILPEDGIKIDKLLPEIPDIMATGDTTTETQGKQAAPLSSVTELVGEEPKRQKIYIIQPGDSLSTIAEHFFCNQKEWMKLYELNKDILTTPSVLKPGTTIRIYSPVISIKNHCE